MITPPNPLIRETASRLHETSRDVRDAALAGIDLTQATMRGDSPTTANERSVTDKLKDAARDVSHLSSTITGLFEKAGL